MRPVTVDAGDNVEDSGGRPWGWSHDCSPPIVAVRSPPINGCFQESSSALQSVARRAATVPRGLNPDPRTDLGHRDHVGAVPADDPSGPAFDQVLPTRMDDPGRRRTCGVFRGRRPQPSSSVAAPGHAW